MHLPRFLREASADPFVRPFELKFFQNFILVLLHQPARALSKRFSRKTRSHVTPAQGIKGSEKRAFSTAERGRATPSGMSGLSLHSYAPYNQNVRSYATMARAPLGRMQPLAGQR